MAELLEICRKKQKKVVDKYQEFLYNNFCRQENDELRTGCGSAWLERLVWDQEAAGSNPVTPIPDNNRNPYCDLRV